MPNEDESVAPGSITQGNTNSRSEEASIDPLNALMNSDRSELEEELNLINEDGRAREVDIDVDRVIVLSDTHLSSEDEVEKLIDVLKGVVENEISGSNKKVLLLFNGDISDDIAIFYYLRDKLDELCDERSCQYVMFTAEHEALKTQGTVVPAEKYALRVKVRDGNEIKDEGSKLELLTHFRINVEGKVVRILPGIDVEVKESFRKRGIDYFINYVKEHFEDWKADIIVSHPGGEEYKLVEEHGEGGIEEKGIVLNKISEILSHKLNAANSNQAFENLANKIKTIAFQALYLIQEIEEDKDKRKSEERESGEEEEGEENKKVGEIVKEILNASPYAIKLAKYLETKGIEPYSFMVDTISETIEEINKEGLKVIKVEGESEALIKENFGEASRVYGHIHELAPSSAIAGKYVVIGEEIRQGSFPLSEVYFFE